MACMEYTRLAPLELEVSALAFGVFSVTGMYGGVGRAEAAGVLREALRLGVNFYDTADVYGYGLGEELVAEAVPGRGVLVATKVGYDFYSNPGGRPRGRYDEEYLEWALERSVERLRREPDVVMVHNPPLDALRGGGVYRFLRRVVARGLALAGGVALGPEVDVLPHALEALKHGEVEFLEFVLNPLEAEPGATIARLARARGVATLARVPHAGGVLDETVTSPPGRLGDHRGLRRGGWYEWALRAYRDLRERVYRYLEGHPARATIALIRSMAPVDVVVLTAPSVWHLHLYIGCESFQHVPGHLAREAYRVYWEHAWESPEAPRESLEALGGLALAWWGCQRLEVRRGIARGRPAR